MKPLALLMWLGIVTTAAAQTEHEEMIFRGVGAVTCGEFARRGKEMVHVGRRSRLLPRSNGACQDVRIRTRRAARLHSSA